MAKIHTILLAARRQGLALSADLHLLEGICDVLGAYCGKVVDAEGERQLHNYLLAIIEPMISALGATLHLPSPPPNSSPAVTSAGTQHQAYAGQSPGAGGGGNGADKTNDGVIISLENILNTFVLLLNIEQIHWFTTKMTSILKNKNRLIIL